MESKRGQVTIFIILGIILLFATAIILVINSRVSEVTQGIPELEKIPTDLEPVRQFVTQCAQQTAIDGLIKMGMQGGYIDSSNFNSNEFNPTEGQAISLPGSGIRIPYWWLMTSGNSCENCAFSSNRPSIDYMQKQLGRYVDDNINLCLADFEELKTQGFSVNSIGSPTTKATFGKQVIIDTQYAVDVSKQTVSGKVTRYVSTIDLDMRSIFDFATSIANSEANESFAEKQAMNVITGFSGLDKNKLPPISAFDIDPGNNVFWLKSEAKSKIKDILASYIPLIQVAGVQNFIPRIYQSDIKTGIYSFATLSTGIKDVSKLQNTYSNLAARFVYLDLWEPYFDIQGRGVTGELIRPESAVPLPLFSGIFGIHSFNYYYQLAFPVLVEVSNPNALKGRGYTFRFALEANVRNNDPLASNASLLQFASEEGSPFCNVEQRTSGNITFNAVDQRGKAVQGVQISYSCADDNCLIGTTQNEKNSSVLVDRLPICAGGTIIGSRSGYLGTPVKYDAAPGQEDKIAVVLQQIKDRNFTIKKKSVIKVSEGNWQFTDAEKRLERDETTVITIERVNENDAEEDFSQTLVMNGTQAYVSGRLTPGRYKLTGTLILNDKVLIPKDRQCSPDPNNPLELLEISEPSKCTDIPEVLFITFPRGGIKLDETTALWDVDEDTVNSNAPIVIYVISTADFDVIDDQGNTRPGLKHADLEQLGKVYDYSSVYWQSLMPKLE